MLFRSGVYGYPLAEAARIAVRCMRRREAEFERIVACCFKAEDGAVYEAALAADPRVLKDPEPTVAVSELADSSVNFVVRPWCNREDYWALRFDLMRKLKEELEAAGCSIPFPQQDVYMHQVPAQPGASGGAV